MAASLLSSPALEQSKFLDAEIVQQIKESFGTPVFVYDEKTLVEQANKALQFPNMFGLTVRYAMKASPNAAILQLFSSLGLKFDASSGYEVRRAILAGISPVDISLSSQELPHDFKMLIDLGIQFNACSLKQLDTFGQLFPGGSCGVRFNPGRGSGGTGKTNVGGPTASFGIWYELIDSVKEIASRCNLTIKRIHTHIGSGSDPAIWQSVSAMSLNLVREFPSADTLNLGGGFKVGRMSYEVTTDLQKVGEPVRDAFRVFAEETGRQIKLEIEPGTFLVANAGALVSTVQDIVATGADGHTFLKLDSGMTDVLRPSLYGAQHPIIIHNNTSETANYVVVGHCCESGDLFSCAPGDPEVLSERLLKKAQIGDVISIEGTGAYCAGMSTKNYNSFPESAEVMIDATNGLHLIRRRQTLDQIVINEIPYRR
jgi:diaminopimelate decarboxylase